MAAVEESSSDDEAAALDDRKSTRGLLCWTRVATIDQMKNLDVKAYDVE